MGDFNLKNYKKPTNRKFLAKSNEKEKPTKKPLEQISLYLKKEELQILEAKAKKMKLKRATYIRSKLAEHGII